MTGSLVVIRRYSSDFEAQLARAILEANGIAAVVLHDDAGGMLPSLSFVEGVRLAVRDVLVDVCPECDHMISIPPQSIPQLREAGVPK